MGHKNTSARELLYFSILCCLGNVASRYILVIALIYYAYLLYKRHRDLETMCYMSLFLVPNIRIMDGLGVSFIVNILISLPCIMLLIQKNFKLERFSFISTLLLLYIELTHIILLNNWGNLPATLSIFFSMYFCIYVFKVQRDKMSIEMSWYFFTEGIILSAVSYMISHMNYTLNIVSSVIRGRRFVGYAGEPNYYALYICLALAVFFCLKDIKRSYYFSVIFLVGIGLLTASKMCYLLMGLILVSGIIIMIKESGRKHANFLITFLLLACANAVMFRKQIGLLFNNFVARAGFAEYSQVDYSKLTTGRVDIIGEYIHLLNQDTQTLIWGKGLQYPKYLYVGAGAHNTILDILLSWGIVGMLAFAIILVFLLKNRETKVHLRISNYLPVLVLIINFFSLSCLNATMFWWVILFSILPIYCYSVNDNRGGSEKNEQTE